MKWIEFKEVSEKEFESLELYGNVSGFQMQPGTKWKKGLSADNLRKLEAQFGFELPYDYRSFIAVMNGIDTDLISIDPDGVEEDTFSQLYYEYPKDFQKAKAFLSEIEIYKKYVHDALSGEGFHIGSLEGFVPTYGHRALAVFKDKSLSPVVSVWGDDVVVLAKNIMGYWAVELDLEYVF